MGMFDKWFSGKHDYPLIRVDNGAVAKLDLTKAQLEEHTRKVDDHLQVVPAVRVVLIPSRG